MKKLVVLSAAVLLSLSVPFSDARADIVASGTTGAFNDAFAQLPEGYANVKRMHVGTASALAQVCDTKNASPPDMVFAIRPMKAEEKAACSGVNISENPVGQFGLVLLTADPAGVKAITRDELFLALAAKVPDPKDSKTLIRNPYRTWSDINPKLPNLPIRIVGPSRHIYAWTTFIIQVVRNGCDRFEAFQEMARQDEKTYLHTCGDVRQDGLYEEIGRNFSPEQFKAAKTSAVVVAGYLASDASMADAASSIETSGFAPVALDGVTPSAKTVAEGSYPLGISLIVYSRAASLDQKPEVKTLIKGLQDAAHETGLKHFKGVY